MFNNLRFYCKNFCDSLYSCFVSDSLSVETKLLIISDLSQFLNKLISHLEGSFKNG